MTSEMRPDATGSQDSCLEAALNYARGCWGVIPIYAPKGTGCSCKLGPACGSPGKHPLTKNGLKDASINEEVIRSWWKRWPTANVGIVTGSKSSLVVLDVDPSRGGKDSLAQLIQEHGPLPTTTEAVTGGGGRHFVFAHPGRVVRNKAGILPGLDVRGDGGYFVAPPSLHVSGRRYEWAGGRDSQSCPPAPMPARLLEFVTANEPSAPSSVSGDGEIPITEGKRNATLASLAGSMRRRAMTEEAILVALREENKRRCRPSLSDEEVERIAGSISRYPPAESQAASQSDCAAVVEAEPIEHLTELGNAHRLVKLHGTDLRYCHAWREWLVWDGKRWARDLMGEIYRRAEDTVAAIYGEARGIIDKEGRKLVAKHATGSEAARKIAAMIELARHQLPIHHNSLDRNPWVLNVVNGTLDLRTGELREHRREDFITKLAPVAYEPEAECPLWEKSLGEMMEGRRALVDYLRRAAGYALTGSVREQVLFFPYGTGANGKTTFLKTIARTMGPDYAMHAAPELLMVKRGESHPTDRADLFGMRFVATVEVEDGRRLAEVLVKQMTGGDPIRARRMRQDSWEFDPTHKVFLAANHKPVIRGTDHAIWRRIRLIPFKVKFEKPDKNLPEKLDSERVGILAWLVRGCIEWQRTGLADPVEVLTATEEYRQEMDSLGDFFGERCVIAKGQTAPAKDLYAEYEDWAKDNGADLLTKSKFGKSLRERGFQPDRNTTVRFWLGIGIRRGYDA